MEPTSPHPRTVTLDPAADPRPPHDRAEDLLRVYAGTRCAATRRRLEADIFELTCDLADQAARRYRGRGVDDDDLQQVSRLALLKAVRRYRPGRAVCFPAYAVPTVTGELKRHFRDCGWAVRPPRQLQERRVALARQEEHLRQELLREPTTAELASGVGVTLDAVREVMAATGGYSTTSLDGHAAGEDIRLEVPDPADAYASLEERLALRWALSGLGEDELHVLRLRFVDELTQAEIGRRIGVSQMQVSRVLAAILGRLRDTMLREEAVA
ncbi:SigB/SigF/SigG family RNA polymerase sigma factor [Phycicoccus ginsengisoli]